MPITHEHEPLAHFVFELRSFPIPWWAGQFTGISILWKTLCYCDSNLVRTSVCQNSCTGGFRYRNPGRFSMAMPRPKGVARSIRSHSRKIQEHVVAYPSFLPVAATTVRYWLQLFFSFNQEWGYLCSRTWSGITELHLLALCQSVLCFFREKLMTEITQKNIAAQRSACSWKSCCCSSFIPYIGRLIWCRWTRRNYHLNLLIELYWTWVRSHEMYRRPVDWNDDHSGFLEFNTKEGRWRARFCDFVLCFRSHLLMSKPIS